MMEWIRTRSRRRSPRTRRGLPVLATVAVAGVLLAMAPPAEAGELKDVRVGRHPEFTRIVFELDRASGYQIERNAVAPGIAEMVVSLDASGSSGEIDVPKSLIESVRLQSDGRRTVAHIRLKKDGLRHKEMTLREPARIVIDLIDESARSTASRSRDTARAKTASKPAAKPVTRTQAETQSETRTAKAAPKPAPKPIAEPTPEPATPIETAKAAPAPKASAPKPAPKAKAPAPTKAVDEAEAKSSDGAESDEDLANEIRSAAALPAGAPSDPTAPSGKLQPPVPAPSTKGPRTSLPPATFAREEASDGGLFTMQNAAIALAGIVVLVLGSYVVARRRRSEDDDYEDEDDYGDDNPFAGLEGGATNEAATASTPAHETAASSDDDDQADLFAGVAAAAEPADSGPVAIDVPEPTNETKDRGMSMDGTMDFGADPEAATTLSGAPGAGATDLEGVMRMVRELATRVGDLETRLEDAVDAKERLERQVAAQTEELRVQRAAIARTQRAVRNMSQSGDDAATEPAPRGPSPE